jgi:hypothetical protein
VLIAIKSAAISAGKNHKHIVGVLDLAAHPLRPISHRTIHVGVESAITDSITTDPVCYLPDCLGVAFAVMAVTNKYNLHIIGSGPQNGYWKMRFTCLGLTFAAE